MQSMNRHLRLAGVLSLALALFVFAGCSDDGPIAPGAGDQPVSSELAQEWAPQALDMVTEMTTEIPNWAEAGWMGQPKGEEDFPLVWDAEQAAYVYHLEAEVVEGNSSFTTAIDVWLQFRGPNGAMEFPIGATEMEVRMNSSLLGHSEDAEGSTDMEYNFETEMLVSYEQDGSYDVNGSGSSTVSIDHTYGELTESIEFAMAWGVDLIVYAGGCPAGAAFVTVGEYRLDADYDGAGGVAWDLVGPEYSASGSDTIICEAPVW